MKKQNLLKLSLLSLTCLTISACQTSENAPMKDARTAKIDSALQRAAISAEAENSGASLPYLEKIYKRNSEDEIAAVNYAAGLRKAEYINRAEIVLAPFTGNKNASGHVMREFSAIQLTLGNYSAAESYAQKAVIKNEKDYRALHYLGIALDAQMEHEKAERAFRKGLDYWQGNPTSIMNNLALNLTSQGYLDEAAEILHKAKALAPQKKEIERNLRIVTALQQSHQGFRAPKPAAKPKK